MFPAHAEMNQSFMIQDVEPSDVPRARRDEPYVGTNQTTNPFPLVVIEQKCGSKWFEFQPLVVRLSPDPATAAPLKIILIIN